MNRDELEETVRKAYRECAGDAPFLPAIADAVWAKMQEEEPPPIEFDEEQDTVLYVGRDYWSREFAKVAFMCLLGHGDWRSRIEVLVREARDVGRRMAEAMEEK